MLRVPHLTPLVALVVTSALLTAACASNPPTLGDELDNLRAKVVDVVPDADREQQMLAKVDEMEVAFADLGTIVDQDQVMLRELLATYDTTREEIESFLESHRGARVKALERVAQLHFDFKSLAAPDEWKKLAKVESRALTMLANRSLAEQAYVD